MSFLFAGAQLKPTARRSFSITTGYELTNVYVALRFAARIARPGGF
jgi:hypothetical protein